MSRLDLGQATIVYEDPDDGYTEETLENEQVVYVRDHWAIRAGTDDDGNDVMRQIPRDRVYYVERSVEEFEREASTIRHRLGSFADELREKLPGEQPTDGYEHEHESESETIRIEEPGDDR